MIGRRGAVSGLIKGFVWTLDYLLVGEYPNEESEDARAPECQPHEIWKLRDRDELVMAPLTVELYQGEYVLCVEGEIVNG